MATAKKTAVKPIGKGIHIAFRVDAEMLARIDALRVPLSRPWYKAKRSDVLRALVIEALPILQKRLAAPKKGGRA